MFTETQGTIIGVLVVVYFLLLFGVAVYINKKSIKTYDDYNVAGRTVSIFPLILTFVGTAIGGSILLGYMENGYNAGMSQQWINVGILSTGVIMAGFLAKKIRAIGAKHNMVTIGDFTALRYGKAPVFQQLFVYCSLTVPLQVCSLWLLQQSLI